jgi:2-polyprenyl-6-methoxyphenol hydroxylase-like FAD-dependent oxidoreductase
VVGGGLGGLAVALALADCGMRVHVLEKEPEFTEVGAGIQLAPNASRALDRLGVLNAIGAYAVFPKRLMWMNALSGELVTALDVGKPFRDHYDYPYVVMHRGDLLQVLLDACRSTTGITLETSRTVCAVDDSDGYARVTCTDGRKYDAGLVIGADGLWSILRKLIVNDGDPVCSEYVAYRGAIPIEEMSEHAGLDNVVVWTGPNMHLVQYPLRRGELYNQVAVFKSNRYRPDRDDWGTPEELDDHFSIAAAPVRRALLTIKRDRRWPMYDRLPVESWHRNRIVLLGDAAHPMLQYLAQGANQALEDAIAFGDALAAHPDDIPGAIAAYEAARIGHTSRVVTSARAWGDLWHVPQDEIAARDARFAWRSETDYSETDWLYRSGKP